MSLLHFLARLNAALGWLPPPPPDRPPDMDAVAEARHAEIEAETLRRLRGGLHARKADRQLREARQELDRQKARVAVLRQAEIRAQRDGARERAWDG